MNAFPVLLFLLLRSRFRLDRDIQNFWTGMSVIAIGVVVLLQVSFSLSAVDRVVLYLIPLQLFVLARLPEVLGNPSGFGNRGRVFAIIVHAMLAQFVWLPFAGHAFAWLPYQFYSLVWFWQ